MKLIQTDHTSNIISDKILYGDYHNVLGGPNNMFISDEILNCVAFLCIKDENKNYIPRATGFFIQHQENQEKNIIFVYFVTAKHNIEKLRGYEASIRVNKKDGTVYYLPIIDDMKWHSHPTDENVDVAIVPVRIGNDIYIRVIPSFKFLTEEQINQRDVGIGEDVFITGLFTRYYGKEKNLPIIRVGNIAMLPKEKVSVSWHNGCEIDAYLIEARSIGGLSGSPVFFAQSAVRDNKIRIGQQPFYLGGLIHGHWPVDESKIDSVIDISEEKNVNMGIAIVVPAIKILEVLEQKELKKARQAYIKKMENAPVVD